jgi:hypothetical protein
MRYTKVRLHRHRAGGAATASPRVAGPFRRDPVGPEPHRASTVKVHSDSAGVFNRRHLNPGGWVRFTCRFYGAPLRVARKKVRRGGHPLVMVHLIAYDRAGNRGAVPKIYVRP